MSKTEKLESNSYYVYKYHAIKSDSDSDFELVSSDLHAEYLVRSMLTVYVCSLFYTEKTKHFISLPIPHEMFYQVFLNPNRGSREGL